MRYHDPGKIRVRVGVGGGWGETQSIYIFFTVHIFSNACLTEWASGECVCVCV